MDHTSGLAHICLVHTWMAGTMMLVERILGMVTVHTVEVCNLVDNLVWDHKLSLVCTQLYTLVWMGMSKLVRVHMNLF